MLSRARRHLFPLIVWKGHTHSLARRTGHWWRPSITVFLPQHQPPTREKYRWLRCSRISHFSGDILFPVSWWLSPFVDRFMKFFIFFFQNGGKRNDEITISHLWKQTCYLITGWRYKCEAKKENIHPFMKVAFYPHQWLFLHTLLILKNRVDLWDHGAVCMCLFISPPPHRCQATAR
jgi:hypothetical protein